MRKGNNAHLLALYWGISGWAGTRNIKQEAFEKCWAHSLLRAVLHCHSPGVATAATVTRRLRIDVHQNDNAWQRRPLWSHGMGPISQDCTEARYSEWQWHQLGYMQVCISPQTDNHTSTPSTTQFLQAWCRSCHWSEALKAMRKEMKERKGNKSLDKTKGKTSSIIFYCFCGCML